MAGKKAQPPQSDPMKDLVAEKKKLKDDRKQLKVENKKQKKEAKARAKELSKQEAQIADETESGGTASVVVVTTFIVLIWIAILCLLVKLDVGGFGSGVLAPIFADVPVINKILPSSTLEDSVDETEYEGYTSIKDAVDQIKELEMELEAAQTANTDTDDTIASLQAEVERLQTFEDSQVEFEKIKTEFYEEVVYADKGPGAEEYQKYYESMDPTTAEYLYKQVVAQLQEDQEIVDYAQAYSEMKPKAAAGIFEAMADNLDLAARILGQMEASDRGAILGVMNADVAAKITKIMEPDS